MKLELHRIREGKGQCQGEKCEGNNRIGHCSHGVFPIWDLMGRLGFEKERRRKDQNGNYNTHSELKTERDMRKVTTEIFGCYGTITDEILQVLFIL